MNDIIKAGILLNAASVPCRIFMKLCEKYSPDELFTGEIIFDELGLTSAQKKRITSLLAKDSSWPERELERAENFGTRFITAKDLDYPVKLFDLRNPPVGIYVKGRANLSLPSVSIVGTRKPSHYAQNIAAQLAKSLALHGITIISGGAKGIDSAGHRGALANDGVTVAVFGTGIDKVYPNENRDLFNRITEKGALVSEYPFGTSGEGWRFIERNRIIAAISSRTVIAESPEDGGAMHTAKFGFELGREVWAVPGRIDDMTCRGSNMLIAIGAKILVDIDEFVESIAGKRVQLKLEIEEPVSIPELSDDEKIIYSLLQRHSRITIDELMAKSKLDFSTITSALVSLEAEGLIVSEAGRYSSKDVSESKNDNIPHTIPNDAEESSISSDAEKNTISGDEEKTIYSLIREHSRITIDELMLKSKLDFADAVSALITLEADGLIMNQAGRYIVNS